MNQSTGESKPLSGQVSEKSGENQNYYHTSCRRHKHLYFMAMHVIIWQIFELDVEVDENSEDNQRQEDSSGGNLCTTLCASAHRRQWDDASQEVNPLTWWRSKGLKVTGPPKSWGLMTCIKFHGSCFRDMHAKPTLWCQPCVSICTKYHGNAEIS